MVSRSAPVSLLDRVHGVLAGLAVGDALGMPTQSFTRQQIRERWGELTGLVAAPRDQPVAPGMAAGSVTDDTEQALLLAEHLLARDGRVDPLTWAEELAQWEERMRALGSLDLLGPSTRRAVAAIRAGVPPHAAGAAGTTNGAAMRIAPVAVLVRLPVASVPELVAVTDADLRPLLDAVEAACLPTHHTGTAIAGAAAVAAVIAAALALTHDPGHPIEPVHPVDRVHPTALERPGAPMAAPLLTLATRAARLGEQRGRCLPGPLVSARVPWAVAEVAGRTAQEADEWLADVLGTTVASAESVPAALALLPAALDDPRAGLVRAASLGGDTDTVAAMLGAMVGAVWGRSGLPEEWCTEVERHNRLDLRAVAGRLVAVREASRAQARAERTGAPGERS